MLIEGAFMKLPEILSLQKDEYLYEASITNLFSNSLILELNARNIENPLTKVFFEQRYDSEINKRCDIFTNFDFLNPKLGTYGFYSENWIEVKYFGNLDRRDGNMTKSKNAGSIIKDIYRLINYTDPNKNIGRYSLVIFDKNPSDYLAFNRQDRSKRIWLEEILKPGTNQLTFDLSEEPDTIKSLFNINSPENNLILNLNTRTYSFSPVNMVNGYYGYLIQILDYNII